MEEWQKLLSKYFNIKVLDKNSAVIKCGVFNHTENKYTDNILRRLWADGDDEFFIDSMELTYSSIYAYLGFKDKEDYDRYENKVEN